jgi:membrane protease subunit HflC
MKAKRTPLLVGLALALIFAARQALVIVREGESAVVTRFGRPHRTLMEAGLHTRIPWPVERVHRFDTRLHTLRGALEETLTADGKNVLVALYCGWRIADPLLFLERLGSTRQAELSLDGLMRTHKNSALGRIAFSELVNMDAASLKHDEIEQRVFDAIRPEALRRYGIEIAFVGIRQLGLPDSIAQTVFERMRAERQELAERYRSEGEGEALRIRARAESERDQLLARADAEARRLRADGEAEAAAHYQVFAQDPELALFLRKLDALRETIGDQATLVLSAETEPFDLLMTPASSAGTSAAVPERAK